MLNLSAIPDEVAQKFNFEPGFQPNFLKDMDDYRKNFSKKHGIKWEFTNDALIKRYLSFKRSRTALRKNLNQNYQPIQKPASLDNQFEMSQISGSMNNGDPRVPQAEVKKITVIPREN